MTPRRSVRALLLGGTALSLVLAASNAAVAGGAERRIVSKDYAAPSVGIVDVKETTVIAEPLCAERRSIGCVRFASRSQESVVRVRVADRSGMPVLAVMEIDADGDGPWDPFTRRFCGRSGRVRIGPAPVRVTVSVWEPVGIRPLLIYGVFAPYAACGGAVATSGTVRATFST